MKHHTCACPICSVRVTPWLWSQGSMFFSIGGQCTLACTLGCFRLWITLNFSWQSVPKGCNGWRKRKDILKKNNWKQTTPNTQEKKSSRKIVPKRHLTKNTNPNNYQTHCISNRLWRCLKISCKFMSYFQEWVCFISLVWFNFMTEELPLLASFPFSFFFILSGGR